jgi:hypothetical protein
MRILFIALFFSTSLMARPIIRPNLSSAFVDTCACNDTYSVSGPACNRFCATKITNGSDVLFATMHVSELISANGRIQNINGWCNNSLNASDTYNPKCVIEARDEAGQRRMLDVEVTGNSVISSVDTLSDNTNFQLTLIETSSGARSFPIQFTKIK